MTVSTELKTLNFSLIFSRHQSSLRNLLLLSLSCGAIALTTGCGKKTQDLPALSSAPTTTEQTMTAPTATITADPLAIDQMFQHRQYMLLLIHHNHHQNLQQHHFQYMHPHHRQPL